MPNLVTSTAQRKEPKGTYPCILGSSANDPWVIHHVPKDKMARKLRVSYFPPQDFSQNTLYIFSIHIIYMRMRKDIGKGQQNKLNRDAKQLILRYNLIYFAHQNKLF